MPSGSAFPSPPFLLPQLLSNQLSLPPPPASLDTHAPSDADLPPTHTRASHPVLFPPRPLSEGFNDLDFFLPHFPSLAVYQLISAWSWAEEWEECIDVGVKTIWLCYCGNCGGEHFGVWKASCKTDCIYKTKFTLLKVHFKVTGLTLVWPWQLV